MPTRTTRAAGWLALKDYKEEEEEEYLFAQKPIKERGFLSSSFAVRRGQFYLQFQKFHLDFVLESLILNLSLIPLSSDLQNPLLHPAICVLVIVSGSDLRTLSCILLSLFSVLKRNLEKMLCKMVSVPRKKKSGCVPVYLNVYDLTPINGYAYWLGLGIYHSGVQVHGVEYGFGAHDHSTTGVFEVEPKQCPGFTFRKSILVGRTDLGPKEVRAFMEKLAEEYCGNTYHLITRNCNHFCDDVCIRLTCKPIPSWVNRLARLGLFCNCVLPAELNETKVRQVRREDKIQEDIQKKLRSRSSRLPSSSSLSSSSSSLADSLQPSLSSSANRSRRQNRCLPPPVFREHSGFNY